MFLPVQEIQILKSEILCFAEKRPNLCKYHDNAPLSKNR